MNKKKIIGPYHIMFLRFLKEEGQIGSLRKDAFKTNLYPTNFASMWCCGTTKDNYQNISREDLIKKWKSTIQPILQPLMLEIFLRYCNNKKINRAAMDVIKSYNNSSLLKNVHKTKDWDYPFSSTLSLYDSHRYGLMFAISEIEYTWRRNYYLYFFEYINKNTKRKWLKD